MPLRIGPLTHPAAGYPTFHTTTGGRVLFRGAWIAREKRPGSEVRPDIGAGNWLKRSEKTRVPVHS